MLTETDLDVTEEEEGVLWVEFWDVVHCGSDMNDRTGT